MAPIPLRSLSLVLAARAAGLGDPVVQVLADYVHEHSAEQSRALALAVMLRDLGASPPTLRAALLAGVKPEDVLFIARRYLSPQLILTPTGDRALRTAWAR